ncbi:MAG: chemotaxis protein CheX [Pseudomonas sp.]|uniref:chemotaxis protein CheX n=1 Tax=Pseudomonas sp. TaxID=306 RepID=UPI002734F071|nr:chemotaxis protein CheX [Pseudomonas sp.]MDP3847954.1 chemotaxis protein CheX [Pseudomonas sp.]
MTDATLVMSKVLVLDDASEHFEQIKQLCEGSRLLGIKPNLGSQGGVMAILRSNVDLGGILLYENYGGQAQGLTLAHAIHAARPELPIFLRRDGDAGLADLNSSDTSVFCAAFNLSALERFKSVLDSSIFSRVYPTDLVRGITEMTLSSLQTLFKTCTVEVEAPYLVKDQIIYGEVFSMIAIESNWCRGYMMLQTEEERMLDLLRHAAGTDAEPLTFRDLNSVLGEATNLIWGSFKNRYVGFRDDMSGLTQTQVPIIINHQRRYISFGSVDPQLCLKYNLVPLDDPQATPVSVFQRFVFNLSWSPDQFSENPSVEALVDSGELEMF